MCDLSHAAEFYTRSIIPCGRLSSPTLKRFVAICATPLSQLLRPEVEKSLGISTQTSQQVQMEILVEKWVECLIAGYVVLEKSCPWATQNSYNLCKTKALLSLARCFRPKIEMLKISRKISMIIFVDTECIDYS